MKTPRKLVLKKERIRVLGTDSLRAAVGGDQYDSYFCGPFDDGAGNLPDNFFSTWMQWADDTVWGGGGNWEGGGGGWDI